MVEAAGGGEGGPAPPLLPAQLLPGSLAWLPRPQGGEGGGGGAAVTVTPALVRSNNLWGRGEDEGGAGKLEPLV